MTRCSQMRKTYETALNVFHHKGNISPVPNVQNAFRTPPHLLHLCPKWTLKLNLLHGCLVHLLHRLSGKHLVSFQNPKIPSLMTCRVGESKCEKKALPAFVLGLRILCCVSECVFCFGVVVCVCVRMRMLACVHMHTAQRVTCCMRS